MWRDFFASITTLLGIITLFLVILFVGAMPVYASVEIGLVGSEFVALLFGKQARNALISIIVLGFTFLAGAVAIMLLIKFRDLCAYRIGVVSVIACGCIGIGVLVATLALLVTIPPERCDIIELRFIVYAVNTTEGPISDWKKEKGCVWDPSMCILQAHHFIEKHCKRVFVVNVCFESIAVCSAVISVGCTIYGQTKIKDDEIGDEEEDETEIPEGIVNEEEMTDVQRARLHATRLLQSGE